MVITNQDIIDEWSKVDQQIIEDHGDEGDFSRKYMLNPVLFSLLGNVRGKIILDAGSGQGYLSRKLATLGAIVTGIEPANNLMHYAMEREQKEKRGITYIQKDLSAWQPTPESFDIVVANMVFMDIPEWQSAMRNCMTSLKSEGILLFSILHPAFEEDVVWSEQPYVKIEEYFKEYTKKNIVGVSFHRTVSTYVNFIIENGCSITKMVEPHLSDELAEKFVGHQRDNHVPSFLIIKATKR